jgi:hypothetical protein
LQHFDPTRYGPEVAKILSLGDDGNHLLPLTCGPCTNAEARELLSKLEPKLLFPEVDEPEAPMAGLWLYFSCFEEAHKLVDYCESPEGELWHAILHRMEPDSGNAAYWFRKAGQHPVFSILARETTRITKRLKGAEFRTGRWDAFAFISFCDRARTQPGSLQEQCAMEIQRVEWQILFDYSARTTS